jgi:phosphatidylserine/phosphatidylglycerophosphate/cardiolipin synthase-like enzyme
LPAHPNTGGDDTRGQLGSLLEADHGAGRLLACTLYALGDPVCRVYVHAKLAIVDDRWMTVGSANLNEHSLFNDTEVNVVTDDSALIQKTRHRLWAEHLEASTEAVTGEPTELIDKIWRSIASEQHERHKRKEKPTHRLTLLPDVSSRTALLLGPIQGLLVDA